MTPQLSQVPNFRLRAALHPFRLPIGPGQDLVTTQPVRPSIELVGSAARHAHGNRGASSATSGAGSLGELTTLSDEIKQRRSEGTVYLMRPSRGRIRELGGGWRGLGDAEVGGFGLWKIRDCDFQVGVGSRVRS